MSLIRLTVVPNELEAELICALVRTAGFDCDHRRTNLGAAIYGHSLAGGPVEVLVAERDLDAARELLADSSDLLDGDPSNEG